MAIAGIPKTELSVSFNIAFNTICQSYYLPLHSVTSNVMYIGDFKNCMKKKDKSGKYFIENLKGKGSTFTFVWVFILFISTYITSILTWNVDLKMSGSEFFVSIMCPIILITLLSIWEEIWTLVNLNHPVNSVFLAKSFASVLLFLAVESILLVLTFYFRNYNLVCIPAMIGCWTSILYLKLLSVNFSEKSNKEKAKGVKPNTTSFTPPKQINK